MAGSGGFSYDPGVWLVCAPGHDAAPGHIDSITTEVTDEDWYAEILDGTG
jgi:hypothetical protein